MKKNISKKTILDSCFQKQEELIQSFDSRVTEMRADVYGQNQTASQSENRTAGKIEVLSTLESELGFAQMEMGTLKSINPEFENTVVEPGAVVVTDKLIFFIAVSSEKLQIDDEVVYGISDRAPIYSGMQGLKKGDKFEFNGTPYTIENVY